MTRFWGGKPTAKLLTGDELTADLLELASLGLVVPVRGADGDLLWYPANMVPKGALVVSLEAARTQIERIGPSLGAGWN